MQYMLWLDLLVELAACPRHPAHPADVQAIGELLALGLVGGAAIPAAETLPTLGLHLTRLCSPGAHFHSRLINSDSLWSHRPSAIHCARRSFVAFTACSGVEAHTLACKATPIAISSKPTHCVSICTESSSTSSHANPRSNGGFGTLPSRSISTCQSVRPAWYSACPGLSVYSSTR